MCTRGVAIVDKLKYFLKVAGLMTDAVLEWADKVSSPSF